MTTEERIDWAKEQLVKWTKVQLMAESALARGIKTIPNKNGVEITSLIIREAKQKKDEFSRLLDNIG